jgi:hypothetical protein
MTISARTFDLDDWQDDAVIDRKGITSRRSQERFSAEALPASAAGYVYVAVALHTNCFKVGWARDPLKRIHRLQEGSPFELLIVCVIPGDRKTESKIQQSLYRDRTPRGGREWFMRSTDSDAMFPFERTETVIDENSIWWSRDANAEAARDKLMRGIISRSD